MKTSHLFFASTLACGAVFLSAPQANAQSYSMTVRHCQTSYDHQPHTYQTYSGAYQCPGGSRYSYGGSYGYRSRRTSDPLVAQVQAILVQKDLYHHRHHNQVDGIYGSETRHAVEDFQRLEGLPVTGMLDAATLQALGLNGGSISPATAATGTVSSSASPSSPKVPPTSSLAPSSSASAETNQPTDILTTSQVAEVMKVTDEEVIDLLEAGDLHGKKIGGNWRIVRSAIDEFFRSSDQQKEKDKHDHDHDHDHDDKDASDGTAQK